MAATPLFVSTCATCGEPLNARRECLACLVRGGLEQPEETSEVSYSLVFGDFEIERREDGSLWELGHGAMGVTYRALDQVLQRAVALKVIEMPAEERAARAARERFLREARSAAALRHPNVAGVFQFGAKPGGDRCFYAMELVEGETLEALVRREGPLRPGLALEIAIQVARAMVAAAAQSLIHRDLKPANIMLARTGDDSNELTVKVIDFGLAKSTALAAGERDLSHGGFVGTPTFASPEQLGGTPVDARSDIYSLGVTLWYSLTGEVPCPGTRIEEIRSSQAEIELRVGQLVARKIPPPLIKMLRRCLATDPVARPPSARVLLGELELYRAALAAAPRRRRVALALALVGLCGVGLTTYLWHDRSVGVVLAPEKSIAVLPFENLSEDEANAFFVAGIQDDVLTSLTQIRALKVISRASVMAYPPGARNLREIGRAVGVAAVLEGSVRRAGDRVVVNVQLVDTRTGRELWANHYDNSLADSLGLQGELANEIAAALQAKLAPDEKVRLETKPTSNPEAYALYLRARGREAAVNESIADLTAAAELYARAIALDPKFALAYARLSIADTFLAYQPSSDPALRAKARAAAEEALRLSHSLGEAHLALGLCFYFTNNDNPLSALKELSLAAATSPNDPDILQWLAGSYQKQGFWREALETYEHAQELDPRNRQLILRAADNYLLVRDWGRAAACYERALKLAPDSADARISLAYIAVFRDGNLAAGNNLLRNLPPGVDPDGIATESRWDLAMLGRDFANAEKILTDSPVQNFPRSGEGTKEFFEGRTARARGDFASAQRHFAAAAPYFEARARSDPDDGYRHAELGLLYAYMQREEDAIREGQRAVALNPEIRDVLLGSKRSANLALIYALLGKPEEAIPLLQRLLSSPGPVDWPNVPYSITLAELRLRWEWDSLRGDSRFQKLLAGSELGTDLTNKGEAAPAPPEKSIAVLPFANLSDEKDNSYFTTGIQDELLANLSEIADLKVISRTSVMQYQPGTRNLREIGRALGVANIVEGSVQRRGDRVRVIAQLIDARTDTHLWGHTFDRKLSDTFMLEDDLAEEIARQLQARISPQEHSLIKENPTSDLTAYAFYNEAKKMQCQYCDAKIALLEKAISYDPNFILAYCYLAKTEDRRYTSQYFASDPQQEKTGRRVRKLLDHAVQRRPDRGEPHLALAHHFFIAYQFAESRKELDIALPLLPNDSEAIFLDARLDRHGGRWDEALGKARHALTLDPKNQLLTCWIGQTYLNSRRYDEGEKFLRQAIAQNPEGAGKFHNVLATFRLNRGDLASARALCVHPIDDDDVETQFAVAYCLRDYRAAEKIAATAASDTARPWPQNYSGRECEARVYRAAGDAQKARQLFLALRQADDSSSPLADRNEWYFSEAAEFDAALGRKENAIREALHAIDLHPLAAEPINGTTLTRNLALVYAWTGERDFAIAQLQILAKIPSTISYGELRFSPDWDALRGDQRFERLIASLQPRPKG